MANTIENDTFEDLLGDVFSASILIVDDMRLMQKMIGQSLKNAGYVNLHFASDGDEALSFIDKQCPDLVILDLNMPKVSGYEVCKTVRANPELKGLPILVQSAAETAKERTEVFNVGGTDFVSKPINQPELLARVRMHLENKFLISNLSSYHERVRSELAIAREMQEAILPARSELDLIEISRNIKIEAIYQASSELGGDLWGIWELPDNKLGFYVLDVSGHGVGAALNTFRAHSAMDTLSEHKANPEEFLTLINKELVKDFPTGSFATMFYAVINLDSKEMVFAGAGAPNPLIASKNGKIQRLDSSGLPIGIIKSASYQNISTQLNAGDLVFSYSDVLIEAPSDDGSYLGDDGLEQLYANVHSMKKSEKSVIQGIINIFYERVPGTLPDDLTAVGIYI